MGNCLESSVTLILVFLSPDTSQTESQPRLPEKPTEHVDKDLSAASKTVVDSLGVGTMYADQGRRLCAERTGESGTDPAWNNPWSCFGRQSNKRTAIPCATH